MPAISDRYHSVELTDYMDDNFAYVGTRTTGDGAGNFAIIGPGWKGSLPAGVTALPPSSTPWAFLQVRTAVKDASDLDAAHAIQDKYKLTPLSQWGRTRRRAPEERRDLAAVGPGRRSAQRVEDDQPLDARNPGRPARRRLLQSFARIGVGPGLDVDALDASTKRGLARAAVDGRTIINGAFAGGYRQTNVNGWNYPPPKRDG